MICSADSRWSKIHIIYVYIYISTNLSVYIYISVPIWSAFLFIIHLSIDLCIYCTVYLLTIFQPLYYIMLILAPLKSHQRVLHLNHFEIGGVEQLITIVIKNQTVGSQVHQPLRFELPKEFLLADEMCPVCSAGSSSEPWCRPHLPSEFPVIVLGVAWSSKVQLKGASDLLKKLLVLRLIYACACMVLLRRSRDKQDDIYLELSLFDLQQKYGSTDSGRQEAEIRMSKLLPCLKLWK